LMLLTPRMLKAYPPAETSALVFLISIYSSALPVCMNFSLFHYLGVDSVLQLLTTLPLVEPLVSASTLYAGPMAIAMWHCHVCNILMDDDNLLISCPDCHRPVPQLAMADAALRSATTAVPCTLADGPHTLPTSSSHSSS